MSAPRSVTYTAGGELWSVSRMDLLAAACPGLQDSDLPRFHHLVATQSQPAWRLARALYGWHPVVPEPGATAESLQVLGLSAAADRIGITPAQARSLLDSLCALSASIARTAEAPAPAPEPAKRKPTDNPAVRETPGGDMELNLSDSELFARYGIAAPEDHEDRSWLAAKVAEWARLLEQKLVKDVAVATLGTMLQLRRVTRALAGLQVHDEQFATLSRLRNELASTFERQSDQLNDAAGWFGKVGQGVTFHGQMGDLVRAMAQAKASGDFTLVDGIFTATGVAVELRVSAENPLPGYRVGYVAYLQSAKAGLFDPHWKSPFTPAELRRMDAAYQAAYVAALKADGVRIPVLMDDGPAGEYDPLPGEPAAEGGAS